MRLRGPNLTISHKEASGLAAVVERRRSDARRARAALIAGGADAIFETFYKAHDRFAVMSPRRRRFRDRLAPFDAARAGFVLGEGAFGLWVEHRDAFATAVRTGRFSVSARRARQCPSTRGQTGRSRSLRTMRLALEDAGLAPDAVDVVYASANATRGPRRGAKRTR